MALVTWLLMIILLQFKQRDEIGVLNSYSSTKSQGTLILPNLHTHTARIVYAH